MGVSIERQVQRLRQQRDRKKRLADKAKASFDKVDRQLTTILEAANTEAEPKRRTKAADETPAPPREVSVDTTAQDPGARSLTDSASAEAVPDHAPGLIDLLSTSQEPQ